MATTADRTRAPESDRRRGGGVWLVGVLVAMAAIVGLWVWAGGDDSAGPERGVTVEDVAEDEAFGDDGFADGLAGQQVTVSGNVSEVVSASAVRLGGDDFGGDGLLVVGVSKTDLDEGDDVRATGTVRKFDAAQFETEFGWDFYDDAVYDPWKDENVLVARSTTMLDGDG